MHNIQLKIFLLLFLFFSTLLLCSFFRLKELFQAKNGLTSALLLLLFFFLKCQTFWVGRTTLNVEPFIFLFALSIFPFLFLRCVIFGLFGGEKNLLSGPFITLKWKQISLGSFSKIRLDIQSILMYAWSLSFFNFKTNSSFLETTISERAY